MEGKRISLADASLVGAPGTWQERRSVDHYAVCTERWNSARRSLPGTRIRVHARVPRRISKRIHHACSPRTVNVQSTSGRLAETLVRANGTVGRVRLVVIRGGARPVSVYLSRWRPDGGHLRCARAVTGARRSPFAQVDHVHAPGRPSFLFVVAPSPG